VPPTRPPAGARSAGGGDGGPGRSFPWPIVAIIAALVVIAGGVALALSAGGDEEPPAAEQPRTNTVAPPANTPRDEPATKRGDVTVAVLNGTTVDGLAGRVGERIQGSGFDLGTVATNSDQNRSATSIMYAEGGRADALEVGKVIGVGADAVRPVDSGTQLLGKNARVVVIVGADQSQQ
jgi:hypothetical protein